MGTAGYNHPPDNHTDAASCRDVPVGIMYDFSTTPVSFCSTFVRDKGVKIQI